MSLRCRVLVVAAMLSLPASTVARQASGSVTGSVSGRDGEPVAGAVAIAAEAGIETRSDVAGRYTLVLPAGTHTIRVTAAGYESAARVVVIVAGEDARADFQVDPIPRFRDEVTVQAVRADARTPITKTDLTRESIARLDHGQEMPYLLERVPALTRYSDTGLGAGYAYIYLRGVPQTRMNITLDGAPLNEAEDSALYFVDFGDFAASVESVQVQRGVGTSTVGAASFVGSINFASLDFKDEPDVAVRLGGGSFGAARASVAAHSGVLGPGLKLYGRATWQDSDGYRVRSGVEQQSVFFGASQQHDRSFWKVFGFAGRERTQLAFLAVERETLEDDPRFNPMAEEERDRFGQQFVQGQYHRAVGSSTQWSVQGYYNGAGGWYRLWDDAAARVDLQEYGLDWRMLGAAATVRHARGRTALTWGLHANDFRSTHARHVVGGAPDYTNRGLKNEVNTFAKAGVDAGRWHHYGDAQVRWARFAYRGGLDLGSVSWSFFNPKAGTRYDITPRLGVYASVGRALREPGRMDMLSGEDNASAPHDLRAVRPERVIDLEAGTEYRRPGLAVLANVYSMAFRNEIAMTGELSEIGLPLRRNVDRSVRRGLELDVTWQPHPTVRVQHTANASRNRISRWTQFYDTYNEAGDYVTSQPRAHDRVTPLLTPAFVGNLAVDWAPGPHLSAGALGRYVSKAYLDNTNTSGFTTPGYFTLDLSASAGLRRLFAAGSPVVRVFVTNALDRQRIFPSGYSYLYFVRDGAGADALHGIPYYYPSATRSVIVLLDLSR
jgi:iron complex outermembrane receptor protein